ncbi:hypothetical protein [Nocardia stercoris]|uniref:Uncharacterized protein n=1 Tax=Nocardia stercoris TaxID=2483361 RepID=A0A3M2LEI8_9NOCA|nr:hypothetical protein [Nocardia stercoris]RMI35190.1 hypothetical protein EBN03_02495 [Nocardia stercoris]
MPVSFRGIEALESLFLQLVPRPPRSDEPLPIIRLSGDHANTEGVLPMVADALGGAVHASCSATRLDELTEGSSVAENGAPGLTDLRRLMLTLCRAMSGDRFDGGAGPLLFRHYRLVEWLMAQRITGSDQQAQLAALLRRGFPVWGKDLLTEVRPAMRPLQGMLLGLLRLLLPEMVFRARISSWIPVVGREFRWLMRQQYLAPRQSHRFLGFAARLTENGREYEDGDQLAKLLVHAFLEDLRLAYRRRPWHWSAARRTTYPVVLLAGADDDPVARFLVLVNDIRNETGRNDPLLIVAAAPHSAATRPAARAVRGYQAWKKDLPKERQRRAADAWVLALSVPTREPDDTQQPDDFHQISGPAAPAWKRPVGPIVPVVVVALVVALLVWRPWVASPPESSCAAGGPGGSTWVSRFDDPARPDPACVGYSADDGPQGYVFAAQEGQQAQRIVSSEKRVFAQNRVAVELARRYPRRPLFTLVYFGQLSGLEAYDAESEDIEGLALAQYAGLVANSSRPLDDDVRPLLRVILANVGYHVDAGPYVVEKFLQPLISRDPTIVGAVGLDQSRTDTVTMIQRLTALGVPIVGTSLSSDQLEGSSPLYFQLSSSDSDIAPMVGDYLTTLNPKQVRIYRLPPDANEQNKDLYTQETADDLRTEVVNRLPGSVSVWTGSWTDPDAFRTGDGHPACDSVVYYADRDDSFPEFLNALKNGCRSFTGTLVADDSVNRFMSGSDLRARSGLAIPLVYVTKGNLDTCQARTLDLQGDKDFFQLAIPSTGDVLPTLLPDVTVPGWNACASSTGHPLGERVALTYEAAEMFDHAVGTLQTPRDTGWTSKIPLTPTSVWGEMREMQEFDTTTGVVNYPANPTSGRVDHQKWRGLERVGDIADPADRPTLIYGCGRISSRDTIDRCRAYPLANR